MNRTKHAFSTRRPDARCARRGRRAATVPATVVSLPLILAVAALAIDVGHLYVVRATLQNTADASALAGAGVLAANQSQVKPRAQALAALNHPHGNVVDASDVVLGRWSTASKTFTAGSTPYNAVRVTARREAARSNAVSLYFAKIIGMLESDLSATAVAVAGTSGFRFLIDDEMIDSDVPVIENLANSLGKNKDDIISDKNGDGYIDLPPGTTLELPTGQIGDEALFDVDFSVFPFTNSTDPSLEDFLRYNSNGNHYGITDNDLDPLDGVEPVWDEDLYPSFVNPDQVLVSPVYKSDVSNTTPWVNAKGERRGLLAFKIMAVGSDPDGSGSKLPNLVIQVVTPVDPGSVSDNAARLRLVK